ARTTGSVRIVTKRGDYGSRGIRTMAWCMTRWRSSTEGNIGQDATEPRPERASTCPLGHRLRSTSIAVRSVVKRGWSLKRLLMWPLARPHFMVRIRAACLRSGAQDVAARLWNTSITRHSPTEGRYIPGDEAMKRLFGYQAYWYVGATLILGLLGWVG